MFSLRRVNPGLLRSGLRLGAILCILFLSACGGTETAQNNREAEKTLSISGAFALYPMVVRWSEVYRESHPNVRFDISAGGAGKGMTDVLSGAVDIAMVSREVRPEEIEQGAFPVGAAKDAVVFDINEENPIAQEIIARGATKETLAAIWLAENPGNWEDWGGLVSEKKHVIHPYTRSDASGAGEMAAKYLGENAQEKLRGIAVQGDPGLLEAVRKDPLGIGYNNIGFAYDQDSGLPIEGILIVPLDLDGNGNVDPNENFYANKAQIVEAIAAEKYPSPPARALYLVTKGQPSGEAKAFLAWVLTEGQRLVAEAGYVQLPESMILESIERIK